MNGGICRGGNRRDVEASRNGKADGRSFVPESNLGLDILPLAVALLRTLRAGILQISKMLKPPVTANAPRHSAAQSRH